MLGDYLTTEQSSWWAKTLAQLDSDAVDACPVCTEYRTVQMSNCPNAKDDKDSRIAKRRLYDQATKSLLAHLRDDTGCHNVYDANYLFPPRRFVWSTENKAYVEGDDEKVNLTDVEIGFVEELSNMRQEGLETHFVNVPKLCRRESRPG